MMTTKYPAGHKKPKKKDDLLDTLKKQLKKHFSKESRVKETEKIKRIRMLDTREWSMTQGSGKIPEWTNINWSTAKSPVMVHKAWYMVHATPTRTRVKILKSGEKRYYLDIYNHAAKRLPKRRKR